MRISLVVAIAENGVIGRAGRLPWRLPADLRRFKRITMGHHLIMGRKTFESIGRLLPGRTTIVVTRQPGYEAHGAIVARDLAEAIQRVAGDDEVMIVGGSEIYRLAIDRVARLYVTQVHADVAGDTYFPFPQPDETMWQLVEDDRHPADEQNEFDYSFRVYDRHEKGKTLMSQANVQELLDLSQKLLETIAAGDWSTYTQLCDPTLSAFEPEARGHLVEGLDFHQYYFGLGGPKTPKNNTIVAPRVRMLGDEAAVVTYVRLVQHLDGTGQPQTSHFEETRVWQRLDGQWRHVHFHRSSHS